MALDLDHRTVEPATIALARGPRVTLRAARPRDLDGLRALAGKAGLVCDDLVLARLVRADSTGRVVLCATATADTPSGARGGAETILGLGVIELGSCFTMPSLLLVDAELTGGLQEVLAEALLARAREIAGSRVA